MVGLYLITKTTLRFSIYVIQNREITWSTFLLSVCSKIMSIVQSRFKVNKHALLCTTLHTEMLHFYPYSNDLKLFNSYAQILYYDFSFHNYVGKKA